MFCQAFKSTAETGSTPKDFVLRLETWSERQSGRPAEGRGRSQRCRTITAQKPSSGSWRSCVRRMRVLPFAPRKRCWIGATAGPCKGWNSMDRKFALSLAIRVTFVTPPKRDADYPLLQRPPLTGLPRRK